jgi:uncharacterized protein
VLLCDTSGLIAYFDASDTHHRAVDATITDDSGPFVVSPFVLAELDYLLATRRGLGAELAALAELSGGAWELPCFAAADLRLAHSLIECYRDQEIGLADASLIVLADRYATDRVLTLDHRHFRVLRTTAGRALEVLPT